MLKFHKTLKINILIILKIILTTEVVICSALLFDFYVLPNQHTFDLIEGHRSSYGGSRQGKFSSSESNLSYLGEKVKTKKGLQFKLEGNYKGMYDTLELTYSPVFRQVKNIKIANSDNTYKRTIETYSGFLNVAITLFFFLFYAICLGSFWVINAHPDKETLNRVLIVNVFFLLLLVYVWTI